MYKRLLAIIGMSTLSLLSEASTVTLAPQVAGSYQNGNGQIASGCQFMRAPRKSRVDRTAGVVRFYTGRSDSAFLTSGGSGYWRSYVGGTVNVLF